MRFQTFISCPDTDDFSAWTGWLGFTKYAPEMPMKIAILLLSLIFCCCLFFAGYRKPNVRSIKAESERMRYLLFPNKEDGNPFRAVIVGGKELHFQNQITYYKGNDVYEIDKTELSLRPNDSMTDYINALNIEIEKWGEDTDYRRVEFRIDGEIAELTIIPKKGRRMNYKYRIIDNLTVDNTTCYSN